MTEHNAVSNLPEQVRVSVGTAIVLGLLEGKLDAEPTTAYLMTYRDGKCVANCGFCPQARNSRSKAELLSRVSWPVFSTKSVVTGIENAVKAKELKRVCVQALNYSGVFGHLAAFVKALKQRVAVPVSVSCQPLNRENLLLLADAGVNRVGISLDAATERLFNEVKGSLAGSSYSWEMQFRQLREAVEVFGEGQVSTHLIVGLGETEVEAVNLIQQCVDMDVLPGLFAFTPVRGTALENKPQPRIEVYRRVQLARYLIVESMARFEDMCFDAYGKLAGFGVDGEVLMHIVESGQPFLTSGCPDCNRPFYNEKPSGPLYNFPRSVTSGEVAVIMRQLGFEP